MDFKDISREFSQLRKDVSDLRSDLQNSLVGKSPNTSDNGNWLTRISFVGIAGIALWFGADFINSANEKLDANAKKISELLDFQKEFDNSIGGIVGLNGTLTELSGNISELDTQLSESKIAANDAMVAFRNAVGVLSVVIEPQTQ
mmetsp:Transcript_25840/g.54612  ORF Transcript_25840/g.54612 Transcript_25840/m.54612 type:complete len:145 (+) Transcript_25840:1-435(+)